MSEFNPYQSPMAPVEDVPLSTVEFADRGTRLGAAFLDVVPLFGVGIVAAISIPALLATRQGTPDGGSASAGIAFGVILVLGVIAVAVLNLVWIHQSGQTIGKRILKIKVVRTDGQRISLGRYLGLRWLPMAVLGMIPILGPLLGLTDSLLIFRDSYQCLHDQIADTVVVKV